MVAIPLSVEAEAGFTPATANVATAVRAARATARMVLELRDMGCTTSLWLNE